MLDDGLLDLYLVRAPGSAGLARALIALVTHRASACSDITHFQVPAVECITRPSVAVELDGDDFADTPVSIRVVPGALQVMVNRNSGRYKI